MVDVVREARLREMAVWLAVAALFVAPFRASAGLRAGLLVVAALLLILGGGGRQLVPASRSLVLVACAWVTLVALWAMADSGPLARLGSMRGAILTPLLAFGVFYALSRSTAVTARFIGALLIGLVILTGMVILDPFRPDSITHMPAYGSVGFLSTWLILLGALLPLVWQRAREVRMWKAVTILFVVLLLIAAWFTANRMIWLCYAVMLLLGGFLALVQPTHAGRRAAGWAMFGAAAVLALFVAASQVRATLHKAPNGDAVEFLRQDSRAEIWQVALDMIRERPFTGYGVGDPKLGDKFSARFSDPMSRSVFRHAHNVVLNRTLEMGVIGGALVIGLFATLAFAFGQLLRTPGLARLSGICGLALVGGFFLRNMVDDFFLHHTLLLFMALAGMFLGLGHTSNGTKLQPMETRV